MASTVVPPQASAEGACADGSRKPMAFHSTESAEEDLHTRFAQPTLS